MKKPARGTVRATLLAEESAIVEATEAVWREMKRQRISKVGLARRLGVDRSYVTLALDGEQNMTIRTLGRFAHALGRRVQVRLVAAPK